MALGEKSEGEEERSLRDDLSAALKDIEAREASEATAAPQDEETATPEAEAKVEATEAKTERSDGRDAHGRFTKKEGAEQPVEQSADAPAAQAQASEAPTAESQTSSETDAPPKSWRADEAKVWSSLDPVAKAAIVRREAEAARLAGANDGERMFGREFAEIVRPHATTFQQFGVSPQFAVKALLESDQILRSGTPEQKLAKARQLISDYGIDLTQLADTSGMPSDPHVLALQQQVQQLSQRLASPQQQQFAPLPPSQDESNMMAEIEAFRADPAHPHFDAVHLNMGRLLETGAAPDLESAYHAAVAMTPTLRSTGPDPQRTQQEKTAAARQAAASVTGSPGPTGNPKPPTLRDELREQMRSAGFSV